MATRRHFTQEYKDQVVSLVLDSGRTIAEVARSIGVHEMTVGKWVKRAKDAGRVSASELDGDEPSWSGCAAKSSSCEWNVTSQKK